MKILALELSSGRGSVAWISDGCDTDLRTFANDRKHSGLFFQNLQGLTDQHGHPDVIVIGLGPGSYAGVRIAVAAAIGYRLATSARLIGLPSVCGVETDDRDFCVIGDARRDSFFLGRVTNGRLVGDFSLHSRDDLAARMMDFNLPVYASEALPQFRNAIWAYPSAGKLGELARERFSEMIESEILEPIYLRGPHITVPKKSVIAAIER